MNVPRRVDLGESLRDITNFSRQPSPPLLKAPLPSSCTHYHRLVARENKPPSHITRAAASQTGRMGIKQLFSIIKEEAPEAVKEGEIKNHFGRKVAIVSLQWLLHTT